MASSTAQFKRKIRAIEQARKEARAGSVRVIGNTIMREIDANIDRDTNRLARGYALAARGAGVGAGIGVPAISPSKYTGWAREALERQVARFEEQLAEARMKDAELKARASGSAPRGRGRPPGARSLERSAKRVAKAEQRLARAREELGKLDEYAVVFGVFGTGQKGRRLGTTVRNKVYGGEGRLVERRDRSYITIHNKEPHATLVEAQKRVVQSAIAGAKASAKGPAKAAYGAKIRRGFGLGASLTGKR